MYHPLEFLTRLVVMAALTVLLTAGEYVLQAWLNVLSGHRTVIALLIVSAIGASVLVNWLWNSFDRQRRNVPGTRTSFLLAAALLMTLVFGTYLVVIPALNPDRTVLTLLQIAAVTVCLTVTMFVVSALHSGR